MVPSNHSQIDIASLLQPISGESPSGDDLHYTEVFDRIKEARRADDQLDQGEWRTEIKTPDWREVVRLGSNALSQSSKDLRIAVWVVEAWVHLHGFAGLAAGLDLIRGLLQDFWPSLHPLMEDGDVDYRIAPLTFLNEKLPVAVCQVPLCDPERTGGYGYYQWEESCRVGVGQTNDKEQKKRRETLIKEGKISGEAFAAAVNAGSLAFYRELIRENGRSRQALTDLDAVVTEHFEANPPGFSSLMTAIESCARVIEAIYKDKSRSQIELTEEDVQNAVSPGPQDLMPTEDDPGDSVAPPSTMQRNVIEDTGPQEKGLWQQVSHALSNGRLKEAMDQLLCAAAVAPSVREKTRYHLLLAKLCLKADRADLAKPIAEELYKLIESLKLEQWEHPSWIAEVVETLYRCLAADDQADSDRGRTLFQKLCLLNVTRAAAYR